ncbi:hypothetical protein, partial [Sphingomonas sp. FUKUSWIS1]|uniref:hypothetical protein n=1 Tax=Sphingomonas sp. FUKUSWIS1 TaxID=1379701 RepID=UPI001F194D9B
TSAAILTAAHAAARRIDVIGYTSKVTADGRYEPPIRSSGSRSSKASEEPLNAAMSVAKVLMRRRSIVV